MQEIQDQDGRAHRIRNAIASFVEGRLQIRLGKLADDDPKRSELIAQFLPDVWLEDAAKRVCQIRAVTHSLKPIHPDARGTNLYVDPTRQPSHELVGSHVLEAGFTSDVVGNAAALDVYKFLRLDVDGRSLLDWLLDDDEAAVRALSDDRQKAREWRSAFVGLIRGRESIVASHALAKQMYWLVGQDATDDAQYHLLAPLYATSLAHAVYGTLQEDRYGEANKIARSMRRDGKMHDGVLRDYPALAVRRLGGTKPQNISQLNSERGGVNYLLGSLPPQWNAGRPRQLWHVTSIFGSILMRYGTVRPTVQGLLQFLKREPLPTMETRNRVDAYVDSLIDELVAMAAELQRSLPEDWTTDPRCVLVREEQLWLHPQRVMHDEAFRSERLAMDWPARIGHRFGNWLNAQLQVHFEHVGDVEHRHWKKELLVDEGDSGWAQQLDEWRVRLDEPRYISTRRGTV